MTRKDYVAIAAAIKAALPHEMNPSPQERRETCAYIARQLSDLMEQDNQRFDRARFIKACGLTA